CLKRRAPRPGSHVRGERNGHDGGTRKPVRMRRIYAEKGTVSGIDRHMETRESWLSEAPVVDPHAPPCARGRSRRGAVPVTGTVVVVTGPAGCRENPSCDVLMSHRTQARVAGVRWEAGERRGRSVVEAVDEEEAALE